MPSKYNTLVDDFKRAVKRIPFHREISANENTLCEQKNDLLNAYNILITYCKEIFESLKQEDKGNLIENLKGFRNKFHKCLTRIKFKVEYTLGSENNIFLTITESNITKVEMEAVEFLRLCAQTINRNFTGDPLSLNSFINSIKLLETVQGNHEKILTQFITTKLEGKALESVPSTPKNVKEIIESLRNAIKPDSSKVIESKMLALRLDNTKLQDYTTQVEQFAENLQRSLIVEGISQLKAKSMAVEKTIEICKKSAKTDIVKAVIAASSFNDPKEVLAKFITESAEIKEHKVLAYGKNNSNHGNKYGNKNYYNNRGRGNNRGSFRGNFRGNYKGQHNNSYYRGNNRNYFQNNYRGNHNGYHNNSNNRYVRYAENISGPSETWRATIPTQPIQYPNQDNHQNNSQILPYHQS